MKKTLEAILAIGTSILIGCTPVKKKENIDFFNLPGEAYNSRTYSPKEISQEEFQNKYGELLEIDCNPTGEFELIDALYNDGNQVYLVSQVFDCEPYIKDKKSHYIDRMSLVFLVHGDSKRIGDKIIFEDNLSIEENPYGRMFTMSNGDTYFAVDLDRDGEIDFVYYLESDIGYPAPINLEQQKQEGIF